MTAPGRSHLRKASSSARASHVHAETSVQHVALCLVKVPPLSSSRHLESRARRRAQRGKAEPSLSFVVVFTIPPLPPPCSTDLMASRCFDLGPTPEDHQSGSYEEASRLLRAKAWSFILRLRAVQRAKHDVNGKLAFARQACSCAHPMAFVGSPAQAQLPCLQHCCGIRGRTMHHRDSASGPVYKYPVALRIHSLAYWAELRNPMRAGNMRSNPAVERKLLQAVGEKMFSELAEKQNGQSESPSASMLATCPSRSWTRRSKPGKWTGQLD